MATVGNKLLTWTAQYVFCCTDGTPVSVERWCPVSTCRCPLVCRRVTSTGLARTFTRHSDMTSTTRRGRCSLAIRSLTTESVNTTTTTPTTTTTILIIVTVEIISLWPTHYHHRETTFLFLRPYTALGRRIWTQCPPNESLCCWTNWRHSRTTREDTQVSQDMTWWQCLTGIKHLSNLSLRYNAVVVHHRSAVLYQLCVSVLFLTQDVTSATKLVTIEH